MNPMDKNPEQNPQPAPDLWGQAAPAAAAVSTAAAQAPGWERSVLERLAFDTLKEQRAARRWKIFFRLAWLIAFIALVIYLFSSESASSASSTEHTAVVELKGEIASGADASAEYVIAALRTAFEDDGAKAVVLLINSPGGSPVQAGMINDEIVRLKALHKKPMYAVVEESCASAAYYIAAAADSIYVDKASIVGSIGVLMDGFGFTGTMEKLGVERRLLTAGSNKGMLDPFSPMNDKQKAYAQQMLGQIHQQFIAVVRQGRGERLKETEDTFSGLFWTGQEAVKLGLADGLGSLDQVARDVVGAEDVVDYTRRENVAERFAKKFGASVGAGAVSTMRSMMPSLR
ncbi:protease-4 [Comamonas odontotermitis]|uniref:Protease-4 n=1 Tax=Comamonas odontotermitis TaxID=379895 RepID=A0ABR6RF59_9BURK|nr:S49 family peptidase [Comamonas odontotermitis]MBB6577797.1 protease-4 [Comamonas odontotermitis]UBB16339.1 S49 family peptidase [Comamonas odontotermitis]